MYKYDIPYPQKDQYALLYKDVPINVAKSITYLKSKMKAHRDEIGAEEADTYTIVTPDWDVVYTHTFQVGEKGNSKVPYVVSTKPTINYKTVYLYEQGGPLTEIKQDKGHIISYDAICDEEENIITDLNLLRILSKYLYKAGWIEPGQPYIPPIEVMVTRRALVSMATYKPTNKEDFVNLAGCGEKMYIKCGDRFISLIKEYIEKEDKQ